MSEFLIRRAGLDDARTISRLSTETFWETYSENPNSDNDDIRTYMAKAYDVDLLAEELKSGSIVFLLAEIDDRLAGYARLSFGEFAEGVDGVEPMEINRIYLLREFQGLGFGKRLIDACFNVAKEKSCDTVWLSVWKHNPEAKGFYEKMGFQSVGRVMFDLGGTMHEDIVMSLRVDGGS